MSRDFADCIERIRRAFGAVEILDESGEGPQAGAIGLPPTPDGLPRYSSPETTADGTYCKNTFGPDMRAWAEENFLLGEGDYFGELRPLALPCRGAGGG